MGLVRRVVVLPAGILLVACVLSLSQQHALGAEPGSPETLVRQALELRRAGQDMEALVRLERAHKQSPTPRITAQLGLCLQALGRWAEADQRLAQALAAANDPWIEKNRTILKESSEVAKSHVARVEVVGEPSGAEVFINGQKVGQLPLEAAIAVNEGQVDVELQAPGFERAARTIPVSGQGYHRTVIRLKPAGALSDDAPAAVPEATAAPGVREEFPATSVEATPFYRNSWFLGGVGVMVAAGLVAFFLISSGAPGASYDDSGVLQ